MTRLFFTCSIAINLMVGYAPLSRAETWMDTIEYSGTIEIEAAYNTDVGAAQKLEAIIQPEVNANLLEDLGFTTILRLRGDVYDNLAPDIPLQENRSSLSRRWFISDNIDAELREFYFDAYINDTFLRIGKQQIVWGQADGLKVLDVVNPQSFREFILDDVDNSRIPLWAVNAEFSLGNAQALQLIWIPDTTYHNIPDRGSAYAFSSSRLIPQVPNGFNAVVNRSNKGSNTLADSDMGLRYSTFFDGWDITLNYLYHYNDLPVLYREITRTTVTVNPEYERTHLIGSSLSNAFGGYILRSELGYSTNRYHINQGLNDADGIAKTGDFSYVLGLDYGGFDDMFVSGQFFQSILTRDPSGVTRDQVENTLTFLANRTFINETWKAEIQLLYSLNDNDGLFRPKLSHELASNINIWLGADVFYGNTDGLYGQFNDQDRVYVGLEWGF